MLKAHQNIKVLERRGREEDEMVRLDGMRREGDKRVRTKEQERDMSERE